MGFGGPRNRLKRKPGSVSYTKNFTRATRTNGSNDTRVEQPQDLVDDLKKCGFQNVLFFITPSWHDGHPAWIWVWAYK